MDSCSPLALARTHRKSDGESARRLPGSVWNWTQTPTLTEIRGYPRQKSKVSTWVIPTDEELMIARHTGALLGLTEGHGRMRLVVRA